MTLSETSVFSVKPYIIAVVQQKWKTAKMNPSSEVCSLYT